MPGVTGSAATGQAAGLAGLVISYARQQGVNMEPNEVKQLITNTAFDIDQPDTAGLGTPDPAHPGWDQHFGYGLPDLGLALERINHGKYNPEALITSPQWFTPLNVSQQETVGIDARISAPRAAGYTYKLQWAPGIEPAESDFVTVDTQTRATPTDRRASAASRRRVPSRCCASGPERCDAYDRRRRCRPGKRPTFDGRYAGISRRAGLP